MLQPWTGLSGETSLAVRSLLVFGSLESRRLMKKHPESIVPQTAVGCQSLRDSPFLRWYCPRLGHGLASVGTEPVIAQSLGASSWAYSPPLDIGCNNAAVVDLWWNRGCLGPFVESFVWNRWDWSVCVAHNVGCWKVSSL